MLRLLVCVSGGGTNLQAIFDAIDAGKIRNAEIAAVISNNPGAYALERARQHNVEAICLSPKSFESREAFNHALTEKVKEIAPDLIVLAGFLVAVPAEMIEAFPNQIINIHPSLIPAFCGVGFYGLHSVTQNSVVKKVTVFYCFSDPCQLLIYNTPCPDIQVTDFGITHLPVWQAYGCTRTG